MMEQVGFLERIGIPVAMAGQDENTDALILSGAFTVIFGTPETFVGQDKWRKKPSNSSGFS